MDEETRNTSGTDNPIDEEPSADSPADAEETQRFVPRSPLDDLTVSNTAADDETETDATVDDARASLPAGSQPEPDDADESIVTDQAVDDTEVIPLPAHGNDESAALEDENSQERATPPPPAPAAGRTAAQWLSRFKSLSHSNSTATEPAADGPAADAARMSDPLMTPEASESEREIGEEHGHSTIGPDAATGLDEPVIDTEAEEIVVCPVCGNETAALRFCGYCGAPLGAALAAAESHSRIAEFRRRASALVDPAHRIITALPHAITLVAGALIVLVSLLANSAAVALIITCAVVPMLILLTLNQQDVFE